jgi:hypothetical protein
MIDTNQKINLEIEDGYKGQELDLLLKMIKFDEPVKSFKKLWHLLKLRKKLRWLISIILIIVFVLFIVIKYTNNQPQSDNLITASVEENPTVSITTIVPSEVTQKNDSITTVPAKETIQPIETTIPTSTENVSSIQETTQSSSITTVAKLYEIPKIEKNITQASQTEILGTKEVHLTTNNSEFEWLFTAPIDGVYGIHVTGLIDDYGIFNRFEDLSNSGYLNGAYTVKGKGEVWLWTDKIFSARQYKLSISLKGKFDENIKVSIYQPKEIIDITDFSDIEDEISYYGQENLYSLIPAVDGVYGYGLSYADPGVRTEIRLLDKNKKIIKNIAVYFGEGAFTALPITKYNENDVFYISVRQYENYGKYTLSLGKAKPTTDLGEISSTITLSDSIEFNGQENFYTFRTKSNQNIELYFSDTAPKQYLNVKIIIDEKVIKKDIVDENSEHLSFTTEADETYYIKIDEFHDANELGDYALVIHLS